ELHRETDVDERAQDALQPERLAALRGDQDLAERDAGQLLHHEERQAIAVVADLVHRHDRRVLEPALDRRLAQEALDRALAGRRRTHALDRDIATDLLVARRDHLAHSALADQARESIAFRQQRPVRAWLGIVGRAGGLVDRGRGNHGVLLTAYASP